MVQKRLKRRRCGISSGGDSADRLALNCVEVEPVRTFAQGFEPVLQQIKTIAAFCLPTLTFTESVHGDLQDVTGRYDTQPSGDGVREENGVDHQHDPMMACDGGKEPKAHVIGNGTSNVITFLQKTVRPGEKDLTRHIV